MPPEYAEQLVFRATGDKEAAESVAAAISAQTQKLEAALSRKAQ